MPRARREHRLRGHYVLRRVHDYDVDDVDEEDGIETIIEYSTGSDTDEDEPRGRYAQKPRGSRWCKRMNRTRAWSLIRDLVIALFIITWLKHNLTDRQREQLATWQIWSAMAASTIGNTTDSTASGPSPSHSHSAQRPGQLSRLSSLIRENPSTPVAP